MLSLATIQTMDEQARSKEIRASPVMLLAKGLLALLVLGTGLPLILLSGLLTALGLCRPPTLPFTLPYGSLVGAKLNLSLPFPLPALAVPISPFKSILLLRFAISSRNVSLPVRLRLAGRLLYRLLSRAIRSCKPGVGIVVPRLRESLRAWVGMWR